MVASGTGSLPNIATIAGPINPVSGVIKPGSVGHLNTGIISGSNRLILVIGRPNLSGKPVPQSNDRQEE
jgi:hypothetical protein